MKFLTKIGVVLLSINAFGIDSLKFSCEDGTRFDSTRPQLIGPSFTLIAPDKMCGVSMDFKENCAPGLINKENEYLFSWRCDEVFGDLYFNADSGGYAEFRCNGEKVTSDYGHKTIRYCEIERVTE